MLNVDMHHTIVYIFFFKCFDFFEDLKLEQGREVFYFKTKINIEFLQFF